jgi:hypothetical protein
LEPPSEKVFACQSIPDDPPVVIKHRCPKKTQRACIVWCLISAQPRKLAGYQKSAPRIKQPDGCICWYSRGLIDRTCKMPMRTSGWIFKSSTARSIFLPLLRLHKATIFLQVLCSPVCSLRHISSSTPNLSTHTTLSYTHTYMKRYTRALFGFCLALSPLALTR